MVLLWCVAGNEVPQETVDATAVFLFHLFAKDETWSSHHAEEIRRSLGPFPTSAASNACNIVHEILSLASESWKYSVVEDDKLLKEFGHNIVFKYNTSAAPPESTHSHRAKSSGYDSLSDDEMVAQDSQRSELLDLLQSSEAAKSSQAPLHLPPVVHEEAIQYTAEWLRKQCQVCCRNSGGLQWKDLYSGVFELLVSDVENSGIENDVSQLDHLTPFSASLLAYSFPPSCWSFWDSLSWISSRNCCRTGKQWWTLFYKTLQGC